MIARIQLSILAFAISFALIVQATAKSHDISETSFDWTTFDSTNSDLPGEVWSISLASFDDVWTATTGGVARLHKGQWTTYTTDNSDIPFDFAERILVSKRGRVWISGSRELAFLSNSHWHKVETGQLNVPLDHMIETNDDALWVGGGSCVEGGWCGVARLKDDHSTVYGLGNIGKIGNVIKIIEATDNEIWVIGADGIARFINDTWTTFFLRDIIDKPEGPIHLTYSREMGLWLSVGHDLAMFASGSWILFDYTGTCATNAAITDISITPDRSVWVATTMGLNRIRDSKCEAAKYVGDSLKNQPIAGLYAVPNGNLWVLFENRAVGLETAAGEWIPGNSRDQDASDISQFIAQPVAATDGTLWFTTRRNSGLGRLQNPEWRVFSDYTDIKKLAALPAGQVWAGESRGLRRFDGATWYEANTSAFQTYSMMEATKSGDLWIGTDYGLARLHDGIWQRFEFNGSREGIQFTCMTETPDGALWLGTDRNSVVRFSSGQWTTYDSTNSPLNQQDGAIISITSEPTGVVWVGTNYGIVRLYPGKGELITTAVASDALRDNVISSLAVDLEGTIWIGTREGITWYRSGHWQHASTLYGKDADGWIDHLVVGPDGALWVGYGTTAITFEGVQSSEIRIARLNHGKLTIYSSRKSRLPQGQITSLIVTSTGTVWVSTEVGLARLNPTPQRPEVLNLIGLPPDRRPLTSQQATFAARVFFPDYSQDAPLMQWGMRSLNFLDRDRQFKRSKTRSLYNTFQFKGDGAYEIEVTALDRSGTRPIFALSSSAKSIFILHPRRLGLTSLDPRTKHQAENCKKQLLERSGDEPFRAEL
jgi:ligand-binding sensor domain-containing protein